MLQLTKETILANHPYSTIYGYGECGCEPEIIFICDNNTVVAQYSLISSYDDADLYFDTDTYLSRNIDTVAEILMDGGFYFKLLQKGMKYYTAAELREKFSKYTILSAKYGEGHFVLLVNTNNEVKRYLYKTAPNEYWLVPEAVTLEDFISDGWSISEF